MQVRAAMPSGMFAIVLVLIATMVVGVVTVTAQDAATPAVPDEQLPYQASINAGSCDALGDVVFELNEVTQADDAGTPAAPVNGAAVASPAVEGGEIGGDVAESTTEVDASLEELVAEERVIVVYQGTDGTDAYLACGEITGSPTSGALQVELLEDSESGVSGTAMLLTGGEDDDSTTVTILITEGEIETRDQEATPAS
ncbi:MAG TPA: hypothetical protein VGR22_10370 [Thermomicrobiales bacterium]|nr:hypothetical protein [Thermomicrobiales bacterium]